jgi:hypothetical protein
MEVMKVMKVISRNGTDLTRRFTKMQDREQRSTLRWLREIGIKVEGEPPRESDSIVFEQIDPHLATIEDWPGGDISICVFAKLFIARSAGLIRRAEIILPWEHCVLDLTNPEYSSHFKHVIHEFPFPPGLLIRYLITERPLRCCQLEGAIIAIGYGPVPPQYQDGTLIPVQLLLTTDKGDELCFDFKAQVSREVKNAYERRRQERRLNRPERRPIFKREDGQVGDEKNVSLKELIGQLPASEEHDATCDARSSVTKGDR